MFDKIVIETKYNDRNKKKLSKESYTITAERKTELINMYTN